MKKTSTRKNRKNLHLYTSQRVHQWNKSQKGLRRGKLKQKLQSRMIKIVMMIIWRMQENPNTSLENKYKMMMGLLLLILRRSMKKKSIMEEVLIEEEDIKEESTKLEESIEAEEKVEEERVLEEGMVEEEVEEEGEEEVVKKPKQHLSLESFIKKKALKEDTIEEEEKQDMRNCTQQMQLNDKMIKKV